MAQPQLQARLTTGKVAPQLVRLTVPVIGGLIAMMAFNLTDTFFVSRLGTLELAAMTFTFPIIMLFYSMSIGLGAGTSSVLARAIGKEDDEVIRRLATDSLVLAVLLVAALSVVGYLTMDLVFTALGADETTLPLVKNYMGIWYVGSLFVIVPMVANSAIRATGNTKMPGLIMILASAINIPLDAILIFGLFGFPRLELQGAALATLISRSLTLVLSFWVLHKVEGLISFRIPDGRQLLNSWKRILHIGLPAALTNMIIPGTMTLITPMIAAFGADAIAAFGAASRVQSVALIFFFSLSAIIGPFVGQNWAAKRYDRIRLSLKQVYLFCLGFGFFVTLVFAWVRFPVARIFSDSEDVIQIAGAYLMILPISYGLHGILMVANATFNSLGRPLLATFLSGSRMILLFLPLAWVGSRTIGLNGIWLGATVANSCAGLFAIWMTRRVVSDESLDKLERPKPKPPTPHRSASAKSA